MKPGRVETYVHSDSYTENKGGCIFIVRCKSDAAANTDQFKAFCKAIAPLCFAQGENGDVFETFPDALKIKEELETELREKIEITDICVLKL